MTLRLAKKVSALGFRRLRECRSTTLERMYKRIARAESLRVHYLKLKGTKL